MVASVLASLAMVVSGSELLAMVALESALVASDWASALLVSVGLALVSLALVWLALMSAGRASASDERVTGPDEPGRRDGRTALA